MLPEWVASRGDVMDLDPFAPLDLDIDLHVGARSVAGQVRNVDDAFEAAVILGTQGYTDERARRLGCRDVFDLARQLLPLLPMYGGSGDPPPRDVTLTEPELPTGPGQINARLLLESLLYSAPWLVAIAALVISRVSFWSTITIQQFSSAISLGLFVALVVTGAFIQGFARRGVFYALQHDRLLLRWTLRWTLGLGAVVLGIVVVAIYVVLETLERAYTPAATRSFVLFGFSIGMMLLALAPLYLARALWSVLIAAGAGGLVAIVGGRLITHGDYIDPYTAQRVQLAALWTTIVLACALDVRAIIRLAAQPTIATGSMPAPVRRPRSSAVLRAVGGYASYGAGFFALIIVDQLIAGGLARGSFNYNGHYELAVGVALLVLVPTLTYATAASELMPRKVQRELRAHAVGEGPALRRALSAFYRRHLRVTVAVGLTSGAIMFATGRWLSPMTSVTAGLDGVYVLFAGALVAYQLLAVAALSSGLLFGLSLPKVPAAAAWAGTALSLAIGLALGRWWAPEPGALVGLLSGVTLFAVATTVAARRAFEKFDLAYYQAL